MTMLEMYEEVKGRIPVDVLAANTQKDNQSLFGNVVDWCRDYFNTSTGSVWGLATYIVGVYAVDHFLQDELVNKTRKK